MPQANQLFISPIEVGAREREAQALAATLSSLAPNLSASARSALLEKLVHAVGRAKAGPDLARAAERDAGGREWVGRKLGLHRFRRRVPDAPHISDKTTWIRFQVRHHSAGRSLDVWKDQLMYDVRTALKDADVAGSYWSPEHPTVLTQLFRQCARMAGHPIPGDLGAIFRHAKRINRVNWWLVDLRRLFRRQTAAILAQFLPPAN